MTGLRPPHRRPAWPIEGWLLPLAERGGQYSHNCDADQERQEREDDAGISTTATARPVVVEWISRIPSTLNTTP